MSHLSNGFTGWTATIAGRSITFWLFILWYLGWIAWNTLLPGSFRFDPYPYVFLLFLSNTVQLWYLPVITMQSNAFNGSLQQSELLQRQMLEQLKAQNEAIYQQNAALMTLITAVRDLMIDQTQLQMQTNELVQVMQHLLKEIQSEVQEIDQEIDAYQLEKEEKP